VFGEFTSVVAAAAVGAIPGVAVLLGVGVFYGSIVVLSFWPSGRQAKGELQSEPDAEEWR